MDTPIIEINSISKSFKSVKAVDNLSFSIPEGLCFGLLGPNGAGKTTTLEMIEGIQKPNSGEVLLQGKALDQTMKQKIGIQFQSTALPDYLKVQEVLDLFASFYPKNADINELIQLCELSEFLDRDHRKLSGGQKQRLLLALALINDPEVVFLDEPTTGLDPQSRHNFWQLIRSIKKRNKTIVMTTHYMEEAEALCDEIVIMDSGKLLEQGSPKVLLGKYFSGAMIHLPFSESLREKLNQMGFINEQNCSDQQIVIESQNVEQSVRDLIQQQIPLTGLQIEQANLNDLFIKLTGRELRE